MPHRQSRLRDTVFCPPSPNFIQLRIFSSALRVSVPVLSDLPVPLTSFGAARLGNAIYVYGGHTGIAHSYSTEEQSNQLLQLDLSQSDSSWKSLAEGPRLQGLAMVAHDRRLIRIGGVTARNAKGEDHDLHSSDSVAAFDVEQGAWKEMPPLPEPRSSHDAAVIGETLYIIGGWQLDDPHGIRWHSTAWSLDLSQPDAVWQSLLAVPFARRALAVAAHDEKLYVIGGMDEEGGPTTAVEIYDPQSAAWSHGPSLVGKPMTGFGAAAWSLKGRLLVSTMDGEIQQLANDGSAWMVTGKTRDARFFHRLLPLDGETLITIGGANMDSGKFTAPELIRV